MARFRQYRPIGLCVAISLVLVLAVGAPTPLRADPSTPWSGFEEAPVRLIAGQTATGTDAALQFGLQFKVADGWKTYWRYPGEAGAAPRMDWSGSDNVAAIQVAWPAPHRFSAFGFDNFGYDSDVTLPITLRPQSVGKPVTVALKLDYLICSQICVPGQAALNLVLPEGPAASSRFAPEIHRFRDQVPPRGEQSPFTVETLALDGQPGAEVLRLRVSADEAFANPDLLVEVSQPLSLGRPQISLSDDGRLADVRLKVFDGGSGKSLSGQPMRLTLIDGPRAGEHELRLKP